MKKEVQALIHRRRARLVPIILLGLVVLILVIGIVSLAAFFAGGPGRALFYTPTPTPTITPTPRPPTPTVAATEIPPATALPTVTAGPSPTPAPITYTVQSGDTLFAIAQKFKVDVESIRLANKLTSDTLSIGQQLVIPPAGAVQTATPTAIPAGLPRGSKIKYTVRMGDTLESIAFKFNSTADAISRANKNLTNPNLQAGMVLDVPINIVTPTRTPPPTPTTAPPTATKTPPA